MAQQQPNVASSSSAASFIDRTAAARLQPQYTDIQIRAGSCCCNVSHCRFGWVQLPPGAGQVGLFVCHDRRCPAFGCNMTATFSGFPYTPAWVGGQGVFSELGLASRNLFVPPTAGA